MAAVGGTMSTTDARNVLKSLIWGVANCCADCCVCLTTSGQLSCLKKVAINRRLNSPR